MSHVAGDRPPRLRLFQPFGERLEETECTGLVGAQTPQLPLRGKRIELRGRSDERHPVALRIDQPDRAADGGCSSKNAGVQRSLDVAEEGGHRFVRLSLKGV